MIHLECLSCNGHPICTGNQDKMIDVVMTKNVEEATCNICLLMVGIRR